MFAFRPCFFLSAIFGLTLACPSYLSFQFGFSGTRGSSGALRSRGLLIALAGCGAEQPWALQMCARGEGRLLRALGELKNFKEARGILCN